MRDKLIAPWDIPAGVVITADARITAMQEELTELEAEIKEIVAISDESGEDLSDEDLARCEEINNDIERLNRQIKARSVLSTATNNRRSTRRATPEGDDNSTRATNTRRGATRVEPTIRNDDPKHGFKNFGEFAVETCRAGKGSTESIERFKNVASTYSSESDGPSGGYAVPPEFRTAIWEKVTGEDSLLSRTNQLVTGTNSMTMPKDETTPWDTDNGIQAYWENEAGQVTQSKIKLEMETQRLNKLMALVPVSEELLDDAVGLDSYLRSRAPEKMNSKINTAIVRGNGVGKPLGILKSSSLITISKEGGQAAGTIVFENISKMWARMYAASRRNAVWLINQDIEPQLDELAFPGDNRQQYLPANGISGSPLAFLKGRPVVPVEPCSTLGTFGDIILVDLSQYETMTKGEQIRTDVSMHLFFDQGLEAFRFTFRVTGKPKWGEVIQPENGSNTRSWAIALETRS